MVSTKISLSISKNSEHNLHFFLRISLFFQQTKKMTTRLTRAKALTQDWKEALQSTYPKKASRSSKPKRIPLREIVKTSGRPITIVNDKIPEEPIDTEPPKTPEVKITSRTFTVERVPGKPTMLDVIRFYERNPWAGPADVPLDLKDFYPEREVVDLSHSDDEEPTQPYIDLTDDQILKDIEFLDGVAETASKRASKE